MALDSVDIRNIQNHSLRLMARRANEWESDNFTLTIIPRKISDSKGFSPFRLPESVGKSYTLAMCERLEFQESSCEAGLEVWHATCL